MALEAGTYISDLVVTNPTGTDNRREGDDHLRLLKNTLKNTFPNVTGPITPTHTELNHVDGVTSNIQTQLNAKAPTISASNRVNAAYVGGGTVNDTEFGYLDGVQSHIQAQLDTKAAIATAGEIGTYALLVKIAVSQTITPGETLSGVSLRYASFRIYVGGDECRPSGIGDVPPGTWRAMGFSAASGNYYPVTLWQRIA